MEQMENRVLAFLTARNNGIYLILKLLFLGDLGLILSLIQFQRGNIFGADGK